MLPGHRLWLLPLLFVGCAPSMLVVPDSDWQKVPAAERAAIDRKHEATVVAARAELTAASAGLAEAQRPPGARSAPAAGAAAKPDPDADAWTVAIHDHDQQRSAARTRVDAARTEWVRARLVWRQRQVETASARLELLISDRELTRARAIDHTLPGSDHYDSAPLQGQLSRAQKRWHTAAMAARQARLEFERASTTLASAKEAYAQLMRNGPARLELALPPDSDERPRLELTGWTVSRSDIARRRGLRHWLDVASSGAPQLRKREFRLRPAPRMPATETPRTTDPAGAARASSPATPAAPAPAPAPAPPSAKPWDSVEPAPPPRPVAAARSAAVPPPRRPIAAAPPSPKPWDFVEPAPRARLVTARAAPVLPTRKPAAPPSPKPWDFIEPARPAEATTHGQ